MPQPRQTASAPRLLLVSADSAVADGVLAAVGDSAALDVVSTGDLALERVATVPCTGLIVDTELPGTPAVELATRLRTAGRIPSLPILLTAGNHAAGGAGVVTYADRVGEPAALREALLELLSGGGQRLTLAAR